VSTGLKGKLLHELQEYGSTFLYLYVAFGAVIFYREAVLRAENIAFAAYGFALVKAMVMAKFMMLGHAARLGQRMHGRRLIVNIVWRTTLFFLLLVAMTIIEETIVALVHGRPARAGVDGLAGGHVMEMAATALLLWLILLPYFAIRLIGEKLGPGELRRMFFGVD
jgi:hypothetical protein